MKLPQILTILVVLVGLVVGLATGRRVAGGNAGGGMSPLPVSRGGPAARSDRQAVRHAGSSGGGRHELKSLLRGASREMAANSDFAKQIERMSVSALKAMLLDGLYPYKPGEDAGLAMLRSALVRELFKREDENALKWADGLDPLVRSGILSGLINHLAERDFATALPWIERFREEFGQECASGFTHHAIIGATQRGAAALLELKSLYGEKLRGMMIPQGALPEDFDFRLYLEVSAIKGQQYASMHVMGLWAAKDREAAFAYIRTAVETGVPGGVDLFGLAFQGVVKMSGVTAAGGWVAENLNELPTASRASALASLYSCYGPPGPEAAADLARSLPREEDRVTLVASFIRPFPGRGADASYAKVLGSDAAWAQAIESSASRFAETSSQATPETLAMQLAFYEELMAKTAVSEETCERVRAMWRHEEQ